MKLPLLTALLSLFAGAVPAFAAESVFEKTSAASEIRCGYAEWTPVLYKNIETGAMEGLAKDIMDAISAKTGYRVTWAENTGWGTIAEGLTTGRYDMICVTLGMITPRAKAIGFSRPVFYLPVYAVVRQDDMRFDKSLSPVNTPAIKIGVLEGEGSALIAAERFPKATLLAIPQTSDYSMLMEDLKAQKSDLTFSTSETLAAYQKKYPGVFKAANKGEPITVAAVGFGLPADDLRFKTLIDTALQELENEGTLNRIMDTYDAERTIFLRPTTPYALPKN